MRRWVIAALTALGASAQAAEPAGAADAARGVCAGTSTSEAPVDAFFTIDGPAGSDRRLVASGRALETRLGRLPAP